MTGLKKMLKKWVFAPKTQKSCPGGYEAHIDFVAVRPGLKSRPISERCFSASSKVRIALERITAGYGLLQF